MKFALAAGAVALAAGAAYVMSTGALPMGPLPLLLIATLLFGGGAFLAARAADDVDVRLKRESDRNDILQTQVGQQRRAVDTLADGLDVAVLLCEPKSNIVYANRRALEMFRFDGLGSRSVLAVTLSYELEQLVAEAFRTEEAQEHELSFSYPEERVGIARAWADPSSNRVFLSIQDITKLRRLERVRQDFVANVSHELRTPLSVIRAMAETLIDDDGDLDELRSRYLGKIVQEVDRLSLIANDLLVLSVAESNPVRKQACDLADVFRGVIAQLQRKGAEKGLELRYEGPEHLIIEANSAQMSQVALNLIDNALNYTSEGSVCVTMLQPNAETVEVRVTDTGIGIASEQLPRIFERFYRVDKGRSRMTGGTGLGLSIVKHIVESHGGRLRAESELNRGSTFIVTLPAGDVSAAHASSD